MTKCAPPRYPPQESGMVQWVAAPCEADSSMPSSKASCSVTGHYVLMGIVAMAMTAF